MLITVQHQVVHSLDAESMAALKAAIATNGETKIMLVETLAGIKKLLKGETTIMQELDDLTAQVKANTTVIGSAKVLIQGFAQKLADAIAAGPAALKTLQGELKTADDDLAAAVAANTPAAPQP